ncbi:MAG: radical SAM protein [Chloroflexota bacterium]
MRVIARKTWGTRDRPGARSTREEGAIVKDWGGRLPVALIYPNSYHLGMSNLGIHVIYGLLNSYPRVVCERVFFEKDRRNPPAAVESGRPLADFAVLAFSISYELDYFNVVAMLKASGIPLFAADRDERHPLVIAGGPGVTANPAPLSPFFDAICIGEAEPIVPALLPVLEEGIGEARDGLLKALAALPGIYVPSYPPENPIARQFTRDLDASTATSVVLTPDTELGDLFLVEAERGCQRGCRFCLVNTAFSPMRFRSVDRLIEQAREGLRHRRRIGLVGPAVVDHPKIGELLAGLNDIGAEISISSLRISSLSQDILSELARGKAQTIAIAPEAGSERLRRVINKGISEDDILKTADSIGGNRFRQLKLYFIIGLPTETDNDAGEIVRLALAIKERLDRQGGSTRLTLNAAPFVPKAGTPFQWLPMAPQETLNDRLTVLRSSLPLKGIKLNEESPAWSQVQGVLARGDARLAPALADIEEVSLAGWRRAVEKHQLDIDYYVNRKWETGDKLPWRMIDSGMKYERLCGELEKALK